MNDPAMLMYRCELCGAIHQGSIHAPSAMQTLIEVAAEHPGDPTDGCVPAYHLHHCDGKDGRRIGIARLVGAYLDEVPKP